MNEIERTINAMADSRRKAESDQANGQKLLYLAETAVVNLMREVLQSNDLTDKFEIVREPRYISMHKVKFWRTIKPETAILNVYLHVRQLRPTEPWLVYYDHFHTSPGRAFGDDALSNLRGLLVTNIAVSIARG